MKRTLLISVAFIAFTHASANAQDWIAGAEGDSSRGYVYLTRQQRYQVAPKRAVIASATASYLFYEAGEDSGTTRVSSPGIGAGIAYQWLFDKVTLTAGPGYEVRWTERRPPAGDVDRSVDHGITGNAGLSYRYTPSTTFDASAAYSGAIEWVWSRAAVLQALSKELRVGPEATFQGNRDIRVRELGGILYTGPVAFRAGTATLRYRDGTEQTRPYFSVGYARRF